MTHDLSNVESGVERERGSVYVVCYAKETYRYHLCYHYFWGFKTSSKGEESFVFSFYHRCLFWVDDKPPEGEDDKQEGENDGPSNLDKDGSRDGEFVLRKLKADQRFRHNVTNEEPSMDTKAFSVAMETRQLNHRLSTTFDPHSLLPIWDILIHVTGSRKGKEEDKRQTVSIQRMFGRHP